HWSLRFICDLSMLSANAGTAFRCLGWRQRYGNPVASTADADEGRRPLSRKGTRTRARLVEAAKRVFERDGFLDARIVDIAKTARVAPGTFYHYFDSKEQLFREVAQAQEQRLSAPPDDGQRETSPDDSPTERIRRANR